MNDQSQSSRRPEPETDDQSLVPVEQERPLAPPADVDERAGSAPGEPIALAGEKDHDLDNTIESLTPLPEEPGEQTVIDDVSDVISPLPNKPSEDAEPEEVRDEVDETIPEPAHEDHEESSFYVRDTEPDAPSPEPTERPHPVSSFFGRVRSAAFGQARGDRDPDELPSSGEPDATPRMPSDPNAVFCPVCSRETQALRFCGYCGAELTERRRDLSSSSPIAQAQSWLTDVAMPLGRWTRPAPLRAIVALGLVLVLLALLANSGALALVIASAILPLAILWWAVNSDVFEREPPYVIAGFGVVGALIGALLAWLASWLVSSQWFDEGVLNYGAAGFGGRFAHAAGNAPVIVWLINGFVIPTAAILGILALPILTRQSLRLRNEIMDGITLAGAVGAGVSIGSALVFVSPLFGQSGPANSASAWTLTTIGLALIRPLIWTLGAGLLGAAAWRYMLSNKVNEAALPLIGGAGILLVFTIMSLQLGVAGLWPEVLFGAVVAIAAAVLYARVVRMAILDDRRILGTDDTRTICQACGMVTPVGSFCSRCAAPLSPDPSEG